VAESNQGVGRDRRFGSPNDVFGAQIGRNYILGGLLGSGAMGSVYNGMSRESSEPVAIKILRPELSSDPQFVSRFVQERTILKRLGGRGVVVVHDLVVEQDTLAIVMELVPGGSLRQYLARHGGRLPEDEAVAIMAQIFDGLDHADAEGVVHRDVKPENILMGDSTSSPEAKLTDFGISGLADGSTVTRLTGMVGTPTYMAPDLSSSAPATAAVDVYAAGVVLYELVAGVAPFTGDHPMAVLSQHMNEVPTRPPGMSDQLWELTSRLLAKNPAERPTALEAGRQLRALGGVPGGSDTATVTGDLTGARPPRSTQTIPDDRPATPVQRLAPSLKESEATVMRDSLRSGPTESSTTDDRSSPQPPSALIKTPVRTDQPQRAQTEEQTILRGDPRATPEPTTEPSRPTLPKPVLIGAGAIVVVALALVLIVRLATPSIAGLASPSAWQVANVNGSNLLTGISCPNANDCVAVDQNGNVVVSADPGGGSSAWRVTNVDGSNALTSVSCPSANDCVAVDKKGNVVVSTDPGGGSSAWHVTNVDGSNLLTGISCPNANDCVAVDTKGNVVVSTDPGGGSSAWHVTNVDGSNVLTSVSCPSANDCVAVDEKGNVVVSTDPGGGGSAWHVTNVDGSNVLLGIFCPSANDCVAVDEKGNVVVSTDPGGGSSSWQVANVDGSHWSRGISCPSANDCVAVDGEGNVVVSTDPGGGSSSWQVANVDGSNVLASVSCPNANDCVAVGRKGNVAVGRS
jgi:serine/threonine-protein kinase